jgi:endonuclease/exonuclease/phosphatase family metal-dependent hydrolase
MSMKLVSINIETNKHYDLILPFLKREKPDVVCLQELLEEDVPLFKQKLDMNVVSQIYHYQRGTKRPELAGKKQVLGIFSKNIISSESYFYEGGRENILLPFNEYLRDEKKQENKALLWADVLDSSGNTFRFATTHFTLTENGESTPHQLQILDVFLKQLDTIGDFILCGDMNAPRGNETFNRLAKKYKDNIPLEYKTSLDQKLHRVPGLELMVDGLFTTPLYSASNIRLVDGVSDHMAIVANIEKN